MAVLAGQKIRASDFVRPQLQSKAANESITSSTALQNDDDLVIALDVGVYVMDVYAIFTAATAGDIKLSWTNTGTMTCRHRSVATLSTNVTNSGDSANVRMQGIPGGFSTAAAYGADGSNQSRAHERLIIEVTVAGSLTLQWAQQASSGTATVMVASTHAEWCLVDDN